MKPSPVARGIRGMRYFPIAALMLGLFPVAASAAAVQPEDLFKVTFLSNASISPDGNAVFQLYEPGTTIGRDNDGLLEFHGQALHGAADGEDATRWSDRLPKSGTYLIVVGSTRGNARFSMDVKIE